MSDRSAGSYGYPDQPGGSYGHPEQRASASGNESYGPLGSPPSSYGYAEAPPAGGSTRPKNLGGEVGYVPRGKLARSGGGFYTLANWGWRFLGGVIDYGPIWVLSLVLAQVNIPIGDRDLNVGLVIFILVIAVNNVYLQGMTGQSIGKRVLGLQLVRMVVSQRGEQKLVLPGVGRALRRQLFHIVDAVVFYIGFLVPLISRNRQTWADMIAKTVVLKEPQPISLAFAKPGDQTLKY
jgi:uncharacterized RDD family membrane protein YckC